MGKRYFWGGLFPDGNGDGAFWGPLFPDPDFGDASYVPANGGATAATFVLSLDVSAQVTYTWVTNVIKYRSGLEKRVSRRTYPKKQLSGSMLLTDYAEVVTLRGALARFAHTGVAFEIGLPWDSTPIEYVTGVALITSPGIQIDWLNVGQAVIVLGLDGRAYRSVIQYVDTDANGYPRITVDVMPNVLHGEIFPLVPCFLDPTIGMSRYHSGEVLEQWTIGGRVVPPAYESAARRASLHLGTPTTTGTVLNTVDVFAVTPGTQLTQFSMSADALTSTGELDENLTSRTCIFRFVPGSTTLGNMAVALSRSALLTMEGDWVNTAVLAGGGVNVFGLTALSGGAVSSLLLPGVGAYVGNYLGRPVWNRPVVLTDESAPDSMQSMTEIIDLDGAVDNYGPTRYSDWGRHLGMRGNMNADHQWMIRMLHTIRGRWKTFWLPTWRADLIYYQNGAGSNAIVIRGPSPGTGDFLAWFPGNRQHIQILLETGAVLYRRIVSYVLDEVADLITVTLDSTSPVGDVAKISWLEVVRLESDSVDIKYENNRFEMATTARVIKQASSGVPGTDGPGGPVYVPPIGGIDGGV